jgi:hypothetical protein
MEKASLWQRGALEVALNQPLKQLLQKVTIST